MRSLAAEGIAEKTRRGSGQQLSTGETPFYARFNEERSADPLVLRGGAPLSLPCAAHDARPRRGCRSPDGASRDERGTIAP
jgi:hypothetical protein